MAENNAVAIVKDVSDTVLARINDMVDKQELKLPEGYNAGTALRQAMLIIQDTKDRNGKPALEVCTKTTAVNSLLNMCIQGLQPEKKQCYFITYGNELKLFRSYFGTIAALRNAVPSVGKIVTDIVHQGDEVEYGTSQYGERYIARVVTDPLKNIEKPIAYVFCNIYSKTGELLAGSIMTWGQIQKSWAKSKAGGATQKEFPEEMAKRTVINRACKILLNSSTESEKAVAAAFNYTTDSEYEKEDLDEPKSEKKSFKERYNINSAEAVEAKAEVVPEATPEEPEGPESFESSSFESDSQPTSEEKEGVLF